MAYWQQLPNSNNNRMERTQIIEIVITALTILVHSVKDQEMMESHKIQMLRHKTGKSVKF